MSGDHRVIACSARPPIRRSRYIGAVQRLHPECEILCLFFLQRDVSVEPTHLEEPFKKRPPGKRKRSDGGSSEDPGVSESQRAERPFNGQVWTPGGPLFPVLRRRGGNDRFYLFPL